LFVWCFGFPVGAFIPQKAKGCGTCGEVAKPKSMHN